MPSSLALQTANPAQLCSCVPVAVPPGFPLVDYAAAARIFAAVAPPASPLPRPFLPAGGMR